MNYLIDGHNLIGKLPDIQLSDPDDEAKLVLKLINWSAVGDNRRVIVVFDGGVPGPQWMRFRSDQIKTVFVPKGQSADRWLITFMKREVRDPRQFTIVTSDHAIVKVARQTGIRQVSSDQFADDMLDEMARLLQGGTVDDPVSAEPPLKPIPRDDPKHLSPEEVDAWLDLFGGEQQVELKPYRRRLEPPPPPPPDETAPQPPAGPDDLLLTPDEVSDWLALFGGEPEIKRGGKSDSAEKPSQKRPASTDPKRDPRLSQDDLDLWHSLFGDG